MTLEEAKKLKPGDRVLVEAEVCVATVGFLDQPKHTSCHGNVAVQVAMCGEHAAAYWVVSPEAIRGKIAPPRRMLRKGDIVSWGDELREVEFFNPKPMVGLFNGGDDPEWVEYDGVTLVCAVEDRTDRKGGA